MPATPESIFRAWFDGVWNRADVSTIDRLLHPAGLIDAPAPLVAADARLGEPSGLRVPGVGPAAVEVVVQSRADARHSRTGRARPRR